MQNGGLDWWDFGADPTFLGQPVSGGEGEGRLCEKFGADLFSLISLSSSSSPSFAMKTNHSNEFVAPSSTKFLNHTHKHTLVEKKQGLDCIIMMPLVFLKRLNERWATHTRLPPYPPPALFFVPYYM